VFSSDQPGGLMNVLMGQNMMRRDGEAHRRERFVYYPAISPRAVEATWAEIFAHITAEALDELGETDSTDLVSGYATIVSGHALREMTGLVNATPAEIDAWSQAMIDGIANYGGGAEVEARCHQATGAIDAAIDERLPTIRATPDHSLLSVMTHAGMPEEQVRANIKLTISGGQNEPRDAIAGSVWALLRHPDQLERVRAGEIAWSQGFEEYCRWVAPIGMSPRRVAAEHTYGGVRFEPEERVFLMFGSANRDEAHFDRPERFDVNRDTSPNLTFGVGPHRCAGAAASRTLVGALAVPELFARFPDLRLDESAGEARFGGWAFRGPLSVPVIW